MRATSIFLSRGTIPQGDEGDLSLLQTDFEEHIDRLGLYRGKLTLQGAVRTGPMPIPFYRKGNTARVIALKAVVQRSGIRIVGRQGTWTTSVPQTPPGTPRKRQPRSQPLCDPVRWVDVADKSPRAILLKVGGHGTRPSGFCSIGWEAGASPARRLPPVFADRQIGHFATTAG